MKEVKLFFQINFCILLFFSTHSNAAFPTPEVYDYSLQEVSFSDNQPVVAHVLIINPKTVKINTHTGATLHNRELVSEMIHNYKDDNPAPLAAINGGFFRRGGKYNGVPLSFLQIDSQIFTDPFLNRAAMGIAGEGQKMIIDILQTSHILRINDTEFPINRINQPRQANEAVFYTGRYNTTTNTNKHGREYLILDNGESMEIGTCYPNNHYGAPNNNFSFISRDSETHRCSIYSVHKNIQLPQQIKSKDSVAFITTLRSKNHSPAEWTYMQDIIGGMGLLVKNGEIIPDNDIEKELTQGTALAQNADEFSVDFHDDHERFWFMNKKHPRTAMGVRADGYIIAVVIDGRLEHSAGATLQELAHLMHSLGCVQALNLGGGGDSVMVVDQKIVSTPSGSSTHADLKEERPVSNGILFIRR